MTALGYQYISDRLAPYLQFIPNDEELIYMYLKNDEGLDSISLEGILKIMLSELSLYIKMMTGSEYDIESISLPIENNGKEDLAFFIRKKQLEGITISDALEEDYGNNQFPINKFRVQETGKDIKLRVIKEYEAEKPKVMSYFRQQLAQ